VNNIDHTQETRDAFERLVNIVRVQAAAVKASDLYLNSYDTSAPSAIQRETRHLVEQAMDVLRPSEESN
jgi:hypothetical protein